MGQQSDRPNASPPVAGDSQEPPATAAAHAAVPAADASVTAARASVAARLLANQPSLLAFIRQRLGNAAASERSADDVFATTLRRSDALVRANALLAELPDAALMALAATISHRAILESGRQAARTRRAQESAADLAHVRKEPSAEQLPAMLPELEQVIRAALSEDDFAIIVLRLSDLGWGAVASTLGVTPVAAHRRYYRAVKALSAAVAESRRAPREP